YTAQIVGLSRAESDALLGFLLQHSTAPELVYRHSWRPRDLVIWDNRCTAHYAIPDYKAIGDRYLHRTSVKGDRPMPLRRTACPRASWRLRKSPPIAATATSFPASGSKAPTSPG